MAKTKRAVQKDAHEESKPADVKPTKPSGDSKERRLYQRGPDERVWLTRDEATGEGFYWNDHPENINKATESSPPDARSVGA